MKQKIFEYADGKNYELEVLIEDSVDHELKEKILVATGDAIILDECDKWVYLNYCCFQLAWQWMHLLCRSVRDLP